MLSRKPASGNIHVGYVGEDVKLFSMSREDLADFLVQQLKETKYIGKAPVVSN